MLAVDDPSWSSAVASAAAPGPPVATGPHRRRLIIGSLVAVAAIGGVVLTFDGTDRPEVAPSTTAVPTTRAPLSTSPPSPVAAPRDLSPADGRVVLDDPLVRTYSADTLTPPDPGSSYRLWVTDDPGGPWVSSRIGPARDGGPAFAHATRQIVDGQEVFEHDGVLTAIVSVGDEQTAEVTASGFSADEVVTLVHDPVVQVLGLDSDGSLPAAPHLHLVATAPTPDEVVYGYATSATRYLDGSGEVITLRAAADTVPDRAMVLPYVADGLRTVGDRLVGTLRSNGDTIVVWQFGDFVVTLTGPLDAEAMVQLSLSARQPTIDEWKGLLYGLHPDYIVGPFARMADGPASLAPAWSAGVQLASRGGVTKYLWWWTLPDHPRMASSIEADADLGEQVVVDSVVVHGATYVFVSVPAAQVMRRAVVTAADGTVTTLELQPVFDSQPVLVAATQVTQPGPVTVDLTP